MDFSNPGPNDLAEAMRRQRLLGLVGQLSGDRVLAPIGTTLEKDAAEMPKTQADLLALRMKQTEEEAWNHPAAGGMLRGMIQQFVPQMPIPDETPTQVLRNIAPIAEKYGSSLQGAMIKAGTPHGAQFMEINWTNPISGAQDRHLLNKFDGSRWSLDGKTMISPPIKGWSPSALGAPTGPGAAQDPPAAAAAPAPGPLASPPRRAPSSPATPAATPGYSNTPAGIAAKAIAEGRQPPEMKNQRYAAGVRQELERNGFNLGEASLQWTATQKNLASLNSNQQTRLRQAIGSAPHMLDNIEGLYGEFEKLGGPSGYRVVNKATLAAAKQVPGRLGEVAQALEANIADLVSDLGTIYQGGNTPTEHAMHLALQNLDANWTPGQFRELLKQARKNIGYRLSAMNATGPVGTGGENRYAAGATAAPAAAGGTVTVMWKGKAKTIPAERLQEAIAAGAQEVK